MEGSRYWAGLDMGEVTTTVCVVDGAGEVLHEQSCPSSVEAVEEALNGYAAGLGLIAVEAGVGTHLIRKLRARGLPVQMFEARKASRFLGIRTNKTDAGDAINW